MIEVSRTTTAKIRELRNLAIINAFMERYVKGNQITPLIEDIATEQGVKYSTAYKVIKEYRDNIEYMNRKAYLKSL